MSMRTLSPTNNSLECSEAPGVSAGLLARFRQQLPSFGQKWSNSGQLQATFDPILTKFGRLRKNSNRISASSDLPKLRRTRVFSARFVPSFDAIVV